jgi:phosphate transport system substrate-binding protein
VLGAALALAALAGCARRDRSQSPGSGRTITQIGSTTVLPLAERWRAEFNRARPEVDIAVSGGGSGTGIKALINGTADIANSSREITDKEVEQARAAGVHPTEHVVAYDGIAVIVHPDNPVEEFTLQELSDIFSGEVQQWRVVGVRGMGEIQAVSRDSASGTYEAFKELVVTLGGEAKDRDYGAAVLKQGSNQAVLALVAQTRTAIGYVGLGYLDESVRAVPVALASGAEPVAATSPNVTNGSYPISRALYCYTDGEPTGVLREYLEWVESLEGQSIVKELGFVPVGRE